MMDKKEMKYKSTVKRLGRRVKKRNSLLNIDENNFRLDSDFVSKPSKYIDSMVQCSDSDADSTALRKNHSGESTKNVAV